MQRSSQDKRYKGECYSIPLYRVWFVCRSVLLVILGCQSRELFGGRMLRLLANDFSYNEPTGPTVASPVKLGRRDGEDAPRACLGIGFISQGRLGSGVPSSSQSRKILISEICHMWSICL